MLTKIVNWPLISCVVLSAFLIMLNGCSTDDQQPAPALFYEHPEDANIITSDVTLFWETYDASGNSFRAETFKQNYFEAGTEALKLFFQQKVKNPSRLSNNLEDEKMRNFYLGVRENTENLSATTSEIFSGFSKLKDLYSEAVFSDVVFVIGALSTGGTVVNNGQMVIGTEMFSVDENTPLEGLNEWQKSVVKDQSFIPSIVIHELIHVQQFRVSAEKGTSIVKGKTLLDQTLSEGVADFVTNLVLGSFFNHFIHDYADPIESELWNEFRQEMKGTDISAWLYNGSNSGNRPADLGYYIGYKIAEYYYNQSEDKTIALKTILEIQNGEDFLVLSGYDNKFD